jgi:RNA polymerase sigma factor (sigma-70 family)
MEQLLPEVLATNVPNVQPVSLPCHTQAPPSDGIATHVMRLLPACNPNEADRAQGWQTLWEPVTRAVLRYIQLKNYTSTDDQDILADTMAITYAEVERGHYTPRAGVPFTAYVRGIARNIILEAYRRERRVTALDEEDDTHSLPDTAAVEMEIYIERHEQRDAVRRHLQSLPARRRQVLLMCSEGHDTARIAHELGIREDLVRQEKSRGIRELKRKLAAS